MNSAPTIPRRRTDWHARWIAGALLAVGRLLGADGQLAWDSGEHHLALRDANGEPVWQFNFPAAPGKPHFHPVALPGRPPLTWLAPADHPWHLGFWFSWKFVNGRNFWETDARTGRSEGLTRIVAVRATPRADYSARLELDLAYEPVEGSPAALRETRIVEISPPAEDGSYAFEWTMTFTAGDAPVRLDRTPLPGEPEGKPWGGYAGLIWRFARGFTDWRVVNSSGATGEATHGSAASGCEFSGLIDGFAAGVAMLDHPDNYAAPTPWYVAVDRGTPFGCLMPAPLFGGAHDLRTGESFTLRYRVIVHPGRWSAAQLHRALEAYADQRD